MTISCSALGCALSRATTCDQPRLDRSRQHRSSSRAPHLCHDVFGPMAISFDIHDMKNVVHPPWIILFPSSFLVFFFHAISMKHCSSCGSECSHLVTVYLKDLDELDTLIDVTLPRFLCGECLVGWRVPVLRGSTGLWEFGTVEEYNPYSLEHEVIFADDSHETCRLDPSAFDLYLKHYCRGRAEFASELCTPEVPSTSERLHDATRPFPTNARVFLMDEHLYNFPFSNDESLFPVADGGGKTTPIVSLHSKAKPCKFQPVQKSRQPCTRCGLFLPSRQTGTMVCVSSGRCRPCVDRAAATRKAKEWTTACIL